jgi:hypothetical protein
MKSNCREVISHCGAPGTRLVNSWRAASRCEHVASVPWRTGTTFASPAILIAVTEREPVRAHWHASFFADGMARSVTLAGANAVSATGIA